MRLRPVLLALVLGVLTLPAVARADETGYVQVQSGAQAVNASGYAIGTRTRADGSTFGVLLRPDGTASPLTDLSCPEGGEDRQVSLDGITDAGDIYGTSSLCDPREGGYPVIWRGYDATSPIRDAYPGVYGVTPSGRTTRSFRLLNEHGDELEPALPPKLNGAEVTQCDYRLGRGIPQTTQVLTSGGQVLCDTNGGQGAYLMTAGSTLQLQPPAGFAYVNAGAAGWSSTSPVYGQAFNAGSGQGTLVAWDPPGWTPRVLRDTSGQPLTDGFAPKASSSDDRYLVTATGRLLRRGSPPPVLSGTVRTGDGKPVEGATITVRDQSGPAGPKDVVTGADGTYRLALEAHRYRVTPTFPGGRDFVPVERTVDLTSASGTADFVMSTAQIAVDLKAVGADGAPVDGPVTARDGATVQVTVTNTGDADLKTLTVPDGAPLVVDPRSPGGLAVSGGPPSVDLGPLPAGAQRTFTYGLTATRPGLAALNARVAGQDAVGGDVEAARSLKVVVADVREPRDPDLARTTVVDALDTTLLAGMRAYSAAWTRQAEAIRARMARTMSPAQLKRWFGEKKGLGLDPLDAARAAQHGTSPAMEAVRLPDKPFKGYTAEQLSDVYDQTLKAELGDGVAEWAKGWKKLGAGAQRFASDSWGEAMMSGAYLLGTASPDERAQMEAYWTTYADGVAGDTGSVLEAARREAPQLLQDASYLDETLAGARDQIAGAIDKAVARYAEQRRAITALADTNPVKYQRESAKLDAAIANSVLPFVYDTLLGATAVKAVKGITVAGRGASLFLAGESVGALSESGAVVKGATSSLALSPSAAAQGLGAEAAAQLDTAGFLANTEGATIVQATDAGRVYELPNLGGLPETTIDAKAQVLRDLQQQYLTGTGQSIELAEVAKPGSALRVEGGVAKVELTAQKTGKPAMLDAGAPPEVLGRASVWRNTVSPAKDPTFRTWSNVRQQAALQEWESANKAWAEFAAPAADSKTARLQQCVGQQCRVPLDLEPIGGPGGLQRFVTAEFEVKTIKRGTAEAKLIDVKRYTIEVVDTGRGGKVVNTKTVVDAPKALPQTPDADAVALAKVVGRTPEGRPVLAPLSRAEREFVLPRYVKANVELRRSGAVTDLAEHGVTLVLDDASAKAAGYLLPRFGVPFLPDAIARAYLARIARFVKPAGLTDAQVLEKMLADVTAQGGFGQHAIVITQDSRYLGALEVADW